MPQFFEHGSAGQNALRGSETFHWNAEEQPIIQKD